MTLLVVIGCTPKQQPQAVSSTRIRELHRQIERFHAVRGHLPESISDLCTLSGAECRPEDTIRYRDGWGQGISYRGTGREFELRSAGHDRRLNTNDDLVLSSALERENVRRLSGCYLVEGDTWVDLDQRVRQRVSFAQLRLDTTATQDVGGGYSVAPTPPAYSGGRAFWQPKDSNSLAVVWTVGFANQQLALTARESTLIGQWSIGDDVRTHRAAGRIILRRSRCSRT